MDRCKTASSGYCYGYCSMAVEKREGGVMDVRHLALVNVEHMLIRENSHHCVLAALKCALPSCVCQALC